MTPSPRLAVFLLAVLVVVVMAAGCSGSGTEVADAASTGGDRPSAPDASAADQSAQVGEAAAEYAPEAVQAVLAKVDEQDGATDQVVHKCVGCALMMDGKADYAFEYEGFTMHFCSAHCRDGFSENAEKALMALNLPPAEAE